MRLLQKILPCIGGVLWCFYSDGRLPSHRVTTPPWLFLHGDTLGFTSRGGPCCGLCAGSWGAAHRLTSSTGRRRVRSSAWMATDRCFPGELARPRRGPHHSHQRRHAKRRNNVGWRCCACWMWSSDGRLMNTNRCHLPRPTNQLVLLGSHGERADRAVDAPKRAYSSDGKHRFSLRASRSSGVRRSATRGWQRALAMPTGSPEHAADGGTLRALVRAHVPRMDGFTFSPTGMA